MHGLVRWGFAMLLTLLGAGTVAAELSPQARVGRQLFFEPGLSDSGKLACSSCHDPANAYAAPATAQVVMSGGAGLDRPGLRTVPSLRYLADTPRFSRHSYVDRGSEREDLGPAGGFMLDGRADNLRQQALLPLLDRAEMANGSLEEVARRLRDRSYDRELEQLTGMTLGAARDLVAAAADALERFELEDSSFHPYNSRFDRYLRGESALSADEQEGMRLFISPVKGNCAACHTATTGPGGRPPIFTDFSYHALGVPRNRALAANRQAGFFDLGLCGPQRSDMRAEQQYCGYFKTPTLRNVARRHYFFHNGRFTALADVLHFYVERDTNPGRWYPALGGKLQRFDDLPARYRANVNISDAPLNRDPGGQPALNAKEIEQVSAFLETLNDAD
jgi:cytochrome c peroxidase